jgi:hypothetical protein
VSDRVTNSDVIDAAAMISHPLLSVPKKRQSLDYLRCPQLPERHTTQSSNSVGRPRTISRQK